MLYSFLIYAVSVIMIGVTLYTGYLGVRFYLNEINIDETDR